MACILLGLTVASASRGSAETPKWDVVIPRVAFTNASVSTVLRYVEMETVNLDPERRGIRFLYGETNRYAHSLVTIDWTNATPRWIVNYWFGSTAVLMDDIALMPARPWWPFNRTAAVFGRCCDAVTGEAVNDVQITREKCRCETMSDADGHFVARVPYDVGRPWLEGPVLIHQDHWENITVTVTAKGYEDQNVDVYVGDHKYGTNQESLDVHLKRAQGIRRLWRIADFFSPRTTHIVWASGTVLLLVAAAWQRNTIRRLKNGTKPTLQVANDLPT